MKIKIILILLLFTIYYLPFTILVTPVYARPCFTAPDGTLICPPVTPPPVNPIQRIFGTIQPPDALKKFIGTDPTGATGVSKLLSNLVALIYAIAAIVLIFMILWGAFDWMTSEGDKEKIEKARSKIINAIIGILLFAVAFAVIQLIGQFTGFTFFAGQK